MTLISQLIHIHKWCGLVFKIQEYNGQFFRAIKINELNIKLKLKYQKLVGNLECLEGGGKTVPTKDWPSNTKNIDCWKAVKLFAWEIFIRWNWFLIDLMPKINHRARFYSYFFFCIHTSTMRHAQTKLYCTLVQFDVTNTPTRCYFFRPLSFSLPLYLSTKVDAIQSTQMNSICFGNKNNIRLNTECSMKGSSLYFFFNFIFANRRRCFQRMFLTTSKYRGKFDDCQVVVQLN